MVEVCLVEWWGWLVKLVCRECWVMRIQQQASAVES